MNQAERAERYVEAIHSRVMNEYLRIINIPVDKKKEFARLINDFLQWISYDGGSKNDFYTLTWPRPA
ncbi:hypothetical protein Y032_0759g2115 [Ancylostoma ceylanicum]|uniref:Uncharacterized protein n=1 Tax=Ancylostoma ceylanicum TaxID=53326 RepID=A0A016WE49_9BILA|nr:hypothetical protein Y032_0759g2115 [Ancylostoma ceylanicum]